MAGGDLTEGACIPKKDRVPTSNPLELNPFDLCLIGKGNLLGGCWSIRFECQAKDHSRVHKMHQR